MAEIFLKIEDSPTYAAGDILLAVNDNTIKTAHAGNLCNKRDIGFNSDGLREPGTLTESLLKNFYQYKFERVGPTTVKRINLADQSFDIIGPNGS